MNLRNLTDEELLRHAEAQFDPLTGTELDGELRRRTATLLDEADQLVPVRKWLDDRDMQPAELMDLLHLMNEFHADTAKTLRAKLEHADRWYDIAEEAGDLFQRLQDLTTTTNR